MSGPWRSAGETVVWVAAALVALGVIWRYIFAPIRRAWKAADSKADEIRVALSWVIGQIRANGMTKKADEDKTLRDMLDMVNQRVEDQTKTLEAHATWLRHDKAIIDEHDRRLTEGGL